MTAPERPQLDLFRQIAFDRDLSDEQRPPPLEAAKSGEAAPRPELRERPLRWRQAAPTAARSDLGESITSSTLAGSSAKYSRPTEALLEDALTGLRPRPSTFTKAHLSVATAAWPLNLLYSGMASTTSRKATM
mmetsp:Transcript_89254/g.168147  ORF Transcript_89254/g.168147 Transcript_89254/m.168147 type:complete len:133 (-) Transcript_89254:704-1102(-)